MKIEVGKAYRSREGNRVLITRDTGIGGNQAFEGTIFTGDDTATTTYCESGHWWDSDTEDCEDLISEWTDEPAAAPDAKIKRLEKLTKDLNDELMCEHLPRGSVTTFMGKKLEYWMSVYEKIKRYEGALYYLIERADDSNDARYGTLSASFVRDVCSKALEGKE